MRSRSLSLTRSEEVEQEHEVMPTLKFGDPRLALAGRTWQYESLQFETEMHTAQGPKG